MLKKLDNPALGRRKDDWGVTQAEDKEQRRQLHDLLEELQLRAVDPTNIKGCYITPSACSDVALLQPGFYKPEQCGDEPDFYWVVNNTLLYLF